MIQPPVRGAAPSVDPAARAGDDVAHGNVADGNVADGDLAAGLLREALRCDREGRTAEALERYAAAVRAAETGRQEAVLAEALRRSGVVRHRGNEPAVARDLCRRSYEVAVGIGDDRLAAEALNALAGFALESGELDAARETYHRALALGGASDETRGRIERNLGILANIRGDLAAARAHYERSLAAGERAGDERGCAIAYHNLGMLSADQQCWEDADRYYRTCQQMAEAVGDLHLHGLVLLNHAEIDLARQRHEEARRSAERALTIFDELNSQLDKADAYKVLGVVFRETGQPALAESRLRTAIELAVGTGAVLSEAEAARELALLYQSLGRNQEALGSLNTAHRLFRRLDARVDLVDVAGKVDKLEGTYLAVVRNWGQSIESSDSYTHGHCERVATYGEAVARALGADEGQLTTIRLGAYLHDLGKVRVPHEILNKPGPLSPEEFEIIKRHPIWGIELLAAVEFPWDIKPIIRWHHERYDGTGYPDRLRGDEIPLAAQIICVADVFDALTTNRSYRGAMPRDLALERMRDSRHWWRPDVYAAFQEVV